MGTNIARGVGNVSTPTVKKKHGLDVSKSQKCLFQHIGTLKYDLPMSHKVKIRLPSQKTLKKIKRVKKVPTLPALTVCSHDPIQNAPWPSSKNHLFWGQYSSNLKNSSTHTMAINCSFQTM